LSASPFYVCSGDILGFEAHEDTNQKIAKLMVTSREMYVRRATVASLKKALPGARVRGAGFRGIFIVEAKGDALELVNKVMQECSSRIGRAVPVLAEVQSTLDAIKEGAVKVGVEHIGRDEKFCFRIHKRGAHQLDMDTPEIEREIGGAIWTALRTKYGKKPDVDLDKPDVTVVAEVLGPNTAIGIVKKSGAAAAI
jgi:tRNA(Ser,Leu) C12 N-acetylase TAN1